jgi:hypothetical protein
MVANVLPSSISDSGLISRRFTITSTVFTALHAFDRRAPAQEHILPTLQNGHLFYGPRTGIEKPGHGTGGVNVPVGSGTRLHPLSDHEGYQGPS